MEKMEMKTKNEVMLEKEASAGEQESGKKAEPGKEMRKKEIASEVILQYREYEANLAEVTERVKSHYIAKGNTEESIESIQIYIKPEDFTAYYVINDGIVGKVSLF